jgi:hypothetical protein
MGIIAASAQLNIFLDIYTTINRGLGYRGMVDRLKDRGLSRKEDG